MPHFGQISRMGIATGSAIALVTPTFLPITVAQAQTTVTPTVPAMPTPDEVVECDLLIVGGGLSGTAAAYQSLQAGHTVCLTELTDWVGGQISSQGTTALDESRRQRQLLFYSEGYKNCGSAWKKSMVNLIPVAAGSVPPVSCPMTPTRSCLKCWKMPLTKGMVS